MSTASPDIVQDGNIVSVTLHDPTPEVDALSEAVTACCERMRYDNAVNFLFDLEAVEHLSSACLGALVELHQEIETMRGQIALVHCGKDIESLLEMTNLESVFGVFEDVDEAVEAFHKLDARH